ncbi:MAG TPA: hypothetical protein PKN52_00320 [Trueperaceae bacterium]|nr:hypothetical protein [Trueperaceae bacterium]
MYKLFKTDPNLEKAGIVVDYGDFRVTLARAGGGNRRFAQVLEAKTKPFKRAIQTEMMDNERGLQLLRETYAEAVILNWEVRQGEDWVQGIEAPDGSVMEFSVANVLETFKNLPDLFTDLQEQASKAALFRQTVRENDAGN